MVSVIVKVFEKLYKKFFASFPLFVLDFPHMCHRCYDIFFRLWKYFISSGL